MCVCVCVCVCEAVQSMGFFRQEYCSGVLFHSPRDLPSSGMKPESLASLVLTGRFFTTSATWEAVSSQQRSAGRVSYCRPLAPGESVESFLLLLSAVPSPLVP